MDSTVNIESNHVNTKSFVNEKIKTFELVLSELEAISKKSKNYFVKTLTKDNRIDNALLENFQFESHGFAWFETYRIGLRETFNWLIRLKDSNKAAEIDYNILLYSLLCMCNLIHSITTDCKSRSWISFCSPRYYNFYR